MGADLTIRSIADACKAKFDGAWNAALAKRNSYMRTVSGYLEAPLQGMAAHNYALAQAEVERIYDLRWGGEGRFRDSYNSWCFLPSLGLSWWQDISKLVHKESGRISVRNCRKFLDMIELREPGRPTGDENQKELLFSRAIVRTISKAIGSPPVGEDASVRERHEHFIAKKAELIAFLKRAIALKEPIEASL